MLLADLPERLQRHSPRTKYRDPWQQNTNWDGAPGLVGMPKKTESDFRPAQVWFLIRTWANLVGTVS
jgi:hypothetical protein